MSGRRALTWIVAGAAAVGVLTVARFDPSASPWFPPCVFHRLTGLACPGCGSTRALHALLHADLGAALRFNPLFVLVLPGLAVGMVREWRRVATGRDRIAWRLPAFAIWGFVAILAAFAILRNLPGFGAVLGPGR